MEQQSAGTANELRVLENCIKRVINNDTSFQEREKLMVLSNTIANRKKEGRNHLQLFALFLETCKNAANNSADRAYISQYCEKIKVIINNPDNFRRHTEHYKSLASEVIRSKYLSEKTYRTGVCLDDRA